MKSTEARRGESFKTDHMLQCDEIKQGLCHAVLTESDSKIVNGAVKAARQKDRKQFPSQQV